MTTSNTTFMKTVLFFVISFHLTTVCIAQLRNLITSNICQQEVEGQMVYEACSADSSLVIRFVENQVTVSPESATCGATRERFCPVGLPLSECAFCDSSVPAEAHPVSALTDQTPSGSDMTSWWQSTTWQDFQTPGSLFEVNITISFDKLLMLESDLVVTWAGARARQWVLERSRDRGVSWEAWQEYDSRCKETEITAERPDTVICTPAYSRLHPSTGGQGVFPVTKDRLGLYLGPTFTNYQQLMQAYDTTPLQSFLEFTDIRIRLFKPMTDGLEITNRIQNQWLYYYAISDIQVIASCSCNLHAKYCSLVSGSTACECEHHTTGTDCERCLPLYNNRPWRAGRYVPYPTGTANECQKCQCSDHALSCTYNATLEFGQCDQCLHNTVGVQCEQCLEGYFRQAGVAHNESNSCVLCACEPLGVLNNDTSCDQQTGQCRCDTGVTGRQCDRCQTGFYGLLLPDSLGQCKQCSCVGDGIVSQSSVCDSVSGQCQCKATTGGRDCGECLDGFHAFPYGQPFAECRPCLCNLGGSVSNVCNKETGQCQCRSNVTGQTCDGTAENSFTPALDSFAFQPIATGGTGLCTLTTGLQSELSPFTGMEYAECKEQESVQFENIIGSSIVTQPEVEWLYLPAVRYTLLGETPWLDASLEITVVGTSQFDITALPGVAAGCPNVAGTVVTLPISTISPGVGQAWLSQAPVLIDLRCTYTLRLTVGAKGSATANLTTVDSVVLFPHHASSAHLNTSSNETIATYLSCLTGIASLRTRETTLVNEQCVDLAFSTMSQLTGGALPCDCAPVGSQPLSTCESVGGQCQCEPGVYGRRCDVCAPGYYNITEQGCTACDCDALGSGNLVCDQISGQCPCKANVATDGQMNARRELAGLQCRECIADFYGHQTGQGCVICACDEMGTNSSLSQCNDEGVCTCIPTVTGEKCDTCQPAYFARTGDGCSACNCSEAGSTTLSCNQATGVCTCKANVQGEKCDVCIQDSFNLHVNNPDGCQKCFCFGHGAECTSANGFGAAVISTLELGTWVAVNPNGGPPDDLTHRRAPEDYLGNKLSSYAQYFTITSVSRGNLNISLDAYTPLILEGNGRRVYYNASGQFITPALSSLRFLLHESNFYYNETSAPDYFNFYAILAELEALYIQRKFDSNVVDVFNVTMDTTLQLEPGFWGGPGGDEVEIIADNEVIDLTFPPIIIDTNLALDAILVDNTTQVGFVENCTCTSGRIVFGFSCESCMTGNRRVNTTAGRYATCTLCDCNSRAGAQPVCDENTGICLNCRNGTAGNQCEACADHVTTVSDCTVCEDTFWGLSKAGCQACNCSLVGSVDGVCDKVTGLCTCQPHVVGDKCDQCEDNYYQLTESGCTECDICYNLVLQEVIDLREMRDNLTAALTEAQASDNNTVLGPFHNRLSGTLSQMAKLRLFLLQAQGIQVPVSMDITRLNNSLNNVQAILETTIPAALNQSNVSIAEANTVLESVLVLVAAVNTTITGAYNTIKDHIVPTTDTMARHLDTLRNINNQISQASNSSLGEIVRLSQQVLTIENTTETINTLAQVANQNVTSSITRQNENTVLLSNLERFMTLVRDLGSRTQAGAAEAVTQADLASMETVNVSLVIQALGPSNRDLVAVMRLCDQLITTADRINIMASVMTPEEVDISQVRTAQTLATTARLQGEVDRLIQQSQGVYDKLLLLHTEAVTARNLSEKALSEANRMLDILQNFRARALDIEESANTALDTVQEVTSLSQAAIAHARQLSASLATALSQSQAGYNSVQAANARAARNLASVQPITTDGVAVKNRCVDELGLVSALSQTLVTNNQTKIKPAQDTCHLRNDQVSTIESQGKDAVNKSAQISQTITSSQGRLNALIQQVQDVSTVTQESITELSNLVSQSQTDLETSSIRAAVEALRVAVETRRRWLAEKQAQKLRLQEQMQRLRVIKDQIQP